EELAHLRRQRRLKLVERALDVGQDVRPGEALKQRGAVIERAQLGEGQAATRQGAEGTSLQAPGFTPSVGAPAARAVVVDREPRLLERIEIAADRARADADVCRELRDGAVA